jgi:hypothetical protein
MSKITSVLAAVAVAVSLGAVSANACENSLNTSSRGNHTFIEAETWGDQYVSLDHDGDFGSLQAKLAGRCNKYVAGQYGQGNDSKTKVIGTRNAVGSYQEGNNLHARTSVTGGWNEVATIQTRDGRVSNDVAGYGNVVVTRQH